jgi:hypothetical protein
LVLVALALTIPAGGCNLAQNESLIACTTQRDQIVDVLRIEPEQSRAVLLSVNPKREGKLTVSETQYDIEFPEGPDGAGRLRLSINRYSSHFTRAVGNTPPPGVPAPQPSTGVCQPHRWDQL